MDVPAVHRVWTRPHPGLAPLVGEYRYYRDPGAPERVHLPGDDLTLIFVLAGTLRVQDPDGQVRVLREGEVYLGGLQTRPAGTRADAAQAGIVVRIAPAGAYRLLGGAPQSELVDRSVLMGGCRAVTEQLAEARGNRERFALVDRFLGARMAQATECAQTQWAWLALLRSRGRLRIDALTRELGWSRKRLAARFKDQVGMTPKRAARLLRFDHAMELFRGARMGWAEIAGACGYADQAHLSRELRAFAAASPRELAGRGATKFQDTWLDGRQNAPTPHRGERGGQDGWKSSSSTD